LEPKKEEELLLEVGALALPNLMDDQLDIFIDSEKLHCNMSESMISEDFEVLPF